MVNLKIGALSVLDYSARFLQPFGELLGMDGYIIMAFLLGFPANEIVIPILIMSYLATGSLMDLGCLNQLQMLLVENGWTWLTACLLYTSRCV